MLTTMRISSSLVYSVFLFLALLTSFSCGKKGDPTLKSYERPESPANLRAIHREDKLYLLWNFPRAKEVDIAGFIILKSSGQGQEFEKLLHPGPEKRLHIDTGLSPGIEYRYKILSQNHKAVYSNDSNIISVSLLNTPSPPVQISFRAENNSLFLTWEDTGSSTLYNVYRTYEKGNYGLFPVNKSPLTENHFKDFFTVNKPVYYTIRSQNNTDIRDEGAASPELVVDPFELVPSAPTGLEYFIAPDRVFLYWNEPAETWVTGFRVYRKTEGMDYVLLGETQIPTFVDMQDPSTKRDYRVSAVGPSKEGTASEVKGIIFISGEQRFF